MGRETFTFKLNHQKLSTTLADKLEAELHGDRLPFGKFVEKAELELNDYKREMYKRTQPLTADEIIHVLRSEPEQAGILHLSVPFAWLCIFYRHGETGSDVETWLNYGYEMAYELWQKDKCWVYGNQLANHISWNGMEDDYGKCCFYSSNIGNFYDYDNSTYKEALSYLLILLRKLWQDNENSHWMSYYTADRLALATDKVKNEHLEQQADDEFLELQAQSQKKDSYEYIVADGLFIDLKELQQKLQDYKGSIFIWDC